MVGNGSSEDSRLLALIGDVHGLLDLDELREGLIIVLRRAVPSDFVSLNELGPEPAEASYVVVPPADNPALDEPFERYIHQNPLVRHYREHQDGRAIRFSDLVTQDELHSTDLYREFYAKLGVEYQMAFTLPSEGQRILAIALSRCDRDYSDAERDLVERARPYLIQAYRNALDYDDARRTAAPGGAIYEGLRSLGLTEREAEVMRLVALGRSNGDIASVLSASPRTVEKHVENALQKLGAPSRSRAARIAWEQVGPT